MSIWIELDIVEEEKKIAKKVGQKEAWEFMRRIVTNENNGGFSLKQIREMFGDRCLSDIVRDYSYAEAAEKVKEWEKRIKVGDVVKCINYSLDGVVTSIDESWLNGIATDGASFEWHKDDVIKTGRTLPVEDWLKQIGAEK